MLIISKIRAMQDTNYNLLLELHPFKPNIFWTGLAGFSVKKSSQYRKEKIPM